MSTTNSRLNIRHTIIESYHIKIIFQKVKEALDTQCEIQNGIVIHKRTRRRVAAIMPVYTLGNIPDMEEFRSIADKYHLPLVVDAACTIIESYHIKIIFRPYTRSRSKMTNQTSIEDTNVTDALWDRIITLPCSTNITDNELETVSSPDNNLVFLTPVLQRKSDSNYNRSFAQYVLQYG